MLGLTDPEARLAACRRIIDEHLSVRQTEALVTTGEPTPARSRTRRDAADPGATPAGGKAPHFVDLEDHLKSRFGTNVLVRMKSRERGQIVIEFRSTEEFERLSQTMRG